MATQKGSEHEMPTAQPEQAARVVLEKARAEVKAAIARAKAEEQAKLKAEETLTQVQETLAAAQREVEQERQARVKAEKALTEAQESLAAAQVTVEQERRAGVEAEQAGIEATRTIAEERPTAKVGIGSIEGIGPPVTPEPALPPIAPPATVEVLLPMQPPTLAIGLTVSDVRILRKGAPGGMTLILNPAEAFMVQTRFQLQGPPASALTVQPSPYAIQVYARDVASGTPTVVASHRANLVENVLEYKAQMQAPGLSPGLYRLVTLVTLQGPKKIVGHYEGPIVHVAEVGQHAPGLLVSHS